jgi:hypothetical protein
MNFKSIIALGLGCLSIGIFLPSFTHNAAAEPSVYKKIPIPVEADTRVQTGTMVRRKVTISGYLVGTDGTYNDVPCTTLNVKVIEYGKEVKEPGKFSVPEMKTLAAGKGIKQPDGTCQYELSFDRVRLSSAVFVNEKTYQVEVIGRGYLGSTQHKTDRGLPDNLLLNVVVSSTPEPR